MLSVEHLCKTYAGRAVLTDVTFTLAPGATLGLIGASGSGKTTLGKCLAGVEHPTSGQIRYAPPSEPRPQGSDEPCHPRSEFQMIFQQPASSLNPRFTAAEIVEEPLVIARRGTRAERREHAAQALELTGIARNAMGKLAHQFSGGERQRLAIARALVVQPKLLILDESFNGLDAVVSLQISGLLRQLQQKLDLACILIAHDLALVAQWADQLAVLDHGVLIDYGPTHRVIAEPRHPQTRELILAARTLHPEAFPA
jgi:peptide/nickel transport system ATP-binding protein